MNEITHLPPSDSRDDHDHMHVIFELIMPQISRMKVGDATECEGLFDPEAWNIVPPSQRRYVFGRPVSRLVKEGKVPLEFAGFNSSRHNLYRKI